MALTRNFRKLVREHIAKDPDFARQLLREGIQAMLGGDLETGRDVLRNYIKATLGFEKLGSELGMQSKSLIRMFGPRGNPQARNLLTVIGHLTKHAGITLHITAEPPRPRPGLLAGRLTVPPDFDDALPADVLADFEGR